jgi:sortase A
MPTEEKEIDSPRLNKSSGWIYQAGIVLVAVSALLFFLIFYPVIEEEIRYQLFRNGRVAVVLTKKEAEENKVPTENVLVPVDEKFSIVIPKIYANAKVIPDVDWQNSKEYQKALTEGVAQAKGTTEPGKPGNVFIFAHSGVDFYEAVRYNAVFYLLNKLEKGDEIYLFHDKNKFIYRVTDKKMVAEEQTQYMAGDPQKKTVTLMTCWPPGTTWKRLLVIAEQE